VSRMDLQASANFLAKLRDRMSQCEMKRGVDCGAGIGRITKGFLSKHCTTVDIVEPIKKFTDEIFNGGNFVQEVEEGTIGDVYNVGLEKWEPEQGKYWLIWNQWCLNHLTDADLISYLQRCSKALLQPTPSTTANSDSRSEAAPKTEGGGLIFIKENTSSSAYDIFDEEDSSVTRSDEHFRQIFEKAGLEIVRTELQRGFPRTLGLFPVRMYALRSVEYS